MKNESGSGLSETTEKFIIFEMDGKRYALDLDRIISVSPVPDITPIPESSGTIIGFINHRGDVITVMDLSRLLGGESMNGKGSYILFFEHEGETLGFIVDGVSDILEVDTGSILEPPAHLVNEIGTHVKGFIDDDSRPVIILDLERKIEETVYERRLNDIEGKE